MIRFVLPFLGGLLTAVLIGGLSGSASSHPSSYASRSASVSAPGSASGVSAGANFVGSESYYKTDTFIPPQGSIFDGGESRGMILEKVWNDTTPIIQVQVFKQKCTFPILQGFGFYHLFLIIRTDKGHEYKVHRTRTFIIEKEQFRNETTKYITNCKPKIKKNMGELRQAIKKNSSPFNILTNNCFTFGRRIMQQFGCKDQGQLINDIKYSRT